MVSSDLHSDSTVSALSQRADSTSHSQGEHEGHGMEVESVPLVLEALGSVQLHIRTGQKSGSNRNHNKFPPPVPRRSAHYLIISHIQGQLKRTTDYFEAKFGRFRNISEKVAVAIVVERAVSCQ